MTTFRTVTKWLSVVTLALAGTAFAQTGTAPPPTGNPNDWSAPPLTGAPAVKPAIAVNPDAVGTGIQFHGEISGGTSGFGGSASFGLGFNRVAILFTPTVGVAGGGNNFSVFSTSLDLSVRIYLRQRAAGALVAYLRPGAGVLANISGNFVAFGGSIGFGAGAEYLLTKNLGFTIELALRLSGVTGGVTSASPITVSTVGSVGIMLHQ